MIFFRADSNSQIASGHIMRCLSIAKKFKSKGYDVAFLIADENSIPLFDDSEIPYKILHSQWNDLSDETEKVKDILIGYPNSILFIDTYYVNRNYVDSLFPYAKICYLGSKKEYLGSLDCLINYSADIDYDFYKVNYGADTLLLLGPQYAPLRDEFQYICANKKVTTDTCRILLTTGNTDQHHCVCRILKALTESSFFHKVTIKVVIGKMFEHIDEIRKFFGYYNNISLLENVTSMSSLMQSSDLAISANGTTVYELAASYVPIISFAMAKEQVGSAQALFKLGVVEYVGEMFSAGDECICNIMNRVEMYVQNPIKRFEIAQKAYNVIDGKGCDKIVNVIKQKIIK